MVKREVLVGNLGDGMKLRDRYVKSDRMRRLGILSEQASCSFRYESIGEETRITRITDV